MLNQHCSCQPLLLFERFETDLLIIEMDLVDYEEMENYAIVTKLA